MTSSKSCLIIGDTHFDNCYPGYLDHQIETCFKLVNDRRAKIVVFLGDVYHHRKPHPEVVVKVTKLFQRLAKVPGVRQINVLRGNHDSANKSDDGLTALETLVYPDCKIRLIQHTLLDDENNFLFIPHYEDQDTIAESLTYAADRQTIVFGHFGFAGCLNATGFLDFSLETEVFKNRTILGHIHRSAKEGNITVLGTPWSTNFGECDYEHFTGEMNYSSHTKTWGKLKMSPIDFGIRYYVCPYESLEQMKEEISDPNYFTVLRVLIDKFAEDTSNDLRQTIMKDYGVNHVDLKFQPVFDKKLNNRLSDFDPNVPITSIDSDIIQRYLEDNSSEIPNEDLTRGLDLIKSFEDLNED